MTLKNLSAGLVMVLVLFGCSTAEPPPEEQAAGKDVVVQEPHTRPVPGVMPQIEEAVVTGGRVMRQALAYESRDRLIYHPPLLDRETDRERYPEADPNPVRTTADDPVSTFSIDVDTASYSNVRRMLNQGLLPRHDAVRIEEMINYFSYAYPNTAESDAPFAVFTEVGPSPWHADRHLLHIGIQGDALEESQLPPANLVFLIDVSGSMQSPDKLELVKTSLKMLARRMDRDDRISIAVYAGAAGRVLEPTPGHQTGKIIAAIDRLTAGGSTNGGEGIQLAYAMAQEAFVENGINRVILATDGDFNVGTTSIEALEDLVAARRQAGVALSVLGFGGGNYNDALMQKIAQIGDGNAAYIDTVNEARKVLIDEMAATLNIIARDVKIQVEFNPATVAEYRLIGYETRALAREDFNNDRVDAGDIGAGHTVTAVYELALVGSRGALIDPLRYGARQLPADVSQGELAFVKLRHKLPGADQSRLMTTPVLQTAIADDLNLTSEHFRFAAAVAGFGQLLTGAEYLDDFDYAALLALANGSKGADPFGYRGEFITLVRTAEALGEQHARAPLEVGQRLD